MRETQIIATIGPAITPDKNSICNLVEAGVNIFRINFSHADYDNVKIYIDLIKEINAEFDYNIGLLADLQGPKIRIGLVEEDSLLEPGGVLTFTNQEIKGNTKKVYVNYKYFAQDTRVGERILIDDGKIILEVIETNLIDEVKAKVIQGGYLSSKKSINLPNTKLSIDSVTQKDSEDAIFAIKNDFDWITLPFVRSASDFIKLKSLISKYSNKKINIVAKIEKPEGAIYLEEILVETDAIMIARGDLGVEIVLEETPILQKKIINLARKYNKQVFVSTLMMETMISSNAPTRSEVNDVANIILDGVDAISFSGETSVGQHPVEVIKIAKKIINTATDYLKKEGKKYYIDIKVNKSIKTYIIQYLNFFNEYIYVTKNSEIKINITDFEGGITLNLNGIYNENDETKFELFLKEFMSILNQKFDFENINFEKDTNDFEKKLFITMLKNEVSQLKFKLETKQIELQYLKQELIPQIFEVTNNLSKKTLINKIHNNTKMRDKYESIGDGNSFGPKSKVKNEKIEKGNTIIIKNIEKYEDLKSILSDLSNSSSINAEWYTEFNNSLKTLIELKKAEDNQDEIQKEISISKLSSFFKKAKDVKDWVGIVGLPAEIAIKIPKMFELGKDLLNLVL